MLSTSLPSSPLLFCFLEISEDLQSLSASVSKAGWIMIAIRMGQVYFSVSHIKIRFKFCSLIFMSICAKSLGIQGF